MLTTNYFIFPGLEDGQEKSSENSRRQRRRLPRAQRFEVNRKKSIEHKTSDSSITIGKQGVERTSIVISYQTIIVIEYDAILRDNLSLGSHKNSKEFGGREKRPETEMKESSGNEKNADCLSLPKKKIAGYYLFRAFFFLLDLFICCFCCLFNDEMIL